MKKTAFILAFLMFACSVLAYADDFPIGAPDTSGWFVWERIDDEKAKGTAIDASIYLDAPAGKHGFLHAEGENLYFEDGTRARFWGTNVTADGVWQSSNTEEAKQKINKLVDRIERSGYNLVRFHQIDAGYAKVDVFGKTGTTLQLSEREMDVLGYFISLLKERGIYYYIDLLTNRSVYEDDGIKGVADVSDGWKGVSTFDPYLLQLQKEYAKQLLTYVNPYTGLALKDDPAMVFVDIHNENSIIGMYPGMITTSYYLGQLQSGFNTWLASKYNSIDELASAWQESGKQGLDATEDFTKGTVKFSSDYSDMNYSQMRKHDMYEFLYVLLDEMYIDFRDYLRNNVGVKCLITGTTIGGDNNDRPATFHLLQKDFDFTDRHSYKSHPWGYGFQGGVLTNILTTTITGGGEIFLYTPWTKPYNQPFIIGEWQQCSPNAYAAESEIMMAVYACFQNWNPISFNIISLDIGEGNQPMKNFFDTYHDPMHTAMQPNAAIMFNRGEINEAELEYFVPMDREAVLNPDQTILNGYEEIWMYGKIGVMMTDIDDNPEARQQKNLHKMLNKLKNNEPQSEQINWDRKAGVFKVESEYSNVVTGFIKDKPQSFDFSTITINNSFATVAMNSMTDETLEDSNKILLTVMARARNTGMELSDDGLVVENAGQAPVIVEPISGEIVLKTKKNVKVYALSSSGERISEVPVELTKNGNSTFKIDGKYKAVHYEIVK